MKYFINENEVEWRDYSGVPDLFKEDRGRFKVLVFENSPDLYFGVYELDPGAVHVLHHHTDAAEFYYIVSGKGVARVEDEEKEIGPGDGIYIPVNAKHTIRNTGDTVLRVVWSYDKPRTYGGFVWDDEKVAKIWEGVKPSGSKLVGQK